MSGEDFREYTPKELAEAVLARGDLDVVCFEVQKHDGSVVATDVLQLHVGVDDDFDRTGGYRWVKITGRLES